MTVTNRLEEGFVTANGVLHAAERKLHGLCAICGAGKIIQLIPGRFDPEDHRACRACKGLAAVDEAALRLVE